MRGKCMVNDKVNDMFEQQQNTGKLEERNKDLDQRERVVFSKEERETIYDKLTNYIDIPDMPLDNNDTERLIRDMVMGKKAYILFFLSSGRMRNNKNEFQIQSN